MFKIVSDSPYISKRTPLPAGQTRFTVRATTVGKKKAARLRNRRKSKRSDATRSFSNERIR
jgi:hypothetical protein